MAALTVAAGSSLRALASRKHTSRRIALARSTRAPAYKRTCVKTRAGPEDQLGTGMGDDLNYNVLAERMKALDAKAISGIVLFLATIDNLDWSTARNAIHIMTRYIWYLTVPESFVPLARRYGLQLKPLDELSVEDLGVEAIGEVTELVCELRHPSQSGGRHSDGVDRCIVFGVGFGNPVRLRRVDAGLGWVALVAVNVRDARFTSSGRNKAGIVGEVTLAGELANIDDIWP